MNILVLDEWLPSIYNSGKSIRTFELLAPLAKKHNITYLANIDSAGQEQYVQKMNDAGFETLCVPRPKVYTNPLSVLFGIPYALFDRYPISVRRHFSTDYAVKIQQLIAERKYDLVHIEWTHYAAYQPYTKRLPTFVCTHNVEYLSWYRFVKATPNPVKKLLGLHEGYKLKRFEKEFYNALDYLSVVSEHETALLRNEFGLKNFCVIPNGVAIAHYDTVPNTPKDNHLVYCGSLDAFVNADAVGYFLHDIFPLILQKKPETTFTVIGRNPPDWLLKFQSANVHFTGSVPDIRIALKEAAVEVVPLRIAGGTRLKILEAFAAKVPVLSTSIGAEGLHIEHGKNIVLADEPQEFADKCIELLENADLRNRLISEGRKVVDEEYDWSRISPLVEQAWERARLYRSNR
ncbi:MAG: glycosyltransferase family 4 protein [Planctomycetaceae bacterium]|jgi:glycosyltransferase involved in cell wall biosynthesis|nr:glycosyltransferase family 4 protein [Planctomycetaceae bacterium]